jgi:hypothetical protein
MSDPTTAVASVRVYNRATKQVETHEFRVEIRIPWILDMLAQKAFDAVSKKATVLRNSVVVKLVAK